jgi:hypothetical protein
MAAEVLAADPQCGTDGRRVKWRGGAGLAVRVTAGFVSAILLHLACGLPPFTYVYDVSVPRAPESGQAAPKDGRLTIRLPSVGLRLSALDSVATSSKCSYCFASSESADDAPPRLALLLELKARSAGVSFRPMQVALRLNERESRHPVSYHGPGKQYFQVGWNTPSGADETRCEVAVGFMHERAYLPPRTDDVAHALSTSALCFVLVFDTAVSADGPAVLSLDGLTDGVGAVVVPSIQLKRGQVRSSSLDIWPAWR